MTEQTPANPATGVTEDRFRLQDRPAAARFAERRIAFYWAVTALSALVLAVVYLAGGQPQLEGLLLMVALGTLGLGFVVFARDLLPGSDQTGPRDDHVSSEEQVRLTQESFERGGDPFLRRHFLLRMLAVAGGGLGVAALFPINSLGPHPGDTLAHTKWRSGSRLVTADGHLVKLGDLAENGVLTVFPEGSAGDGDSQTVLINLGDAAAASLPGRSGWLVGGYVAYSKVCTHAGCPVGLYRSSSHQLLCPCHQSTFDVLHGCRPVFGPATRSLPQLALSVGEGDYLEAQHDFSEPIGPGYWNRA